MVRKPMELDMKGNWRKKNWLENGWE